MIPEKDLAYIRKKIKESARPLFFFDDDPDGVSSFVLLYKLTGEGKGVCVKGKPILEESYVKKVEEYSPDLVVVLDKPMIEQEFIDSVSQEIIWLDHHPVQDNKGVKYFNPRKENDEDSRPTSYWAYQIVKEELEGILWIAMIGIIGDWNLLLKDEFRAEFPDLLDESINTPDDALFETKLGKLIKIIDFNLKGSTTDVMKSVKTLTRIETPYEILEQKTSRGKFIYKKFHKVNQKYEELLKQVKVTKDPLLIFEYKDSSLALSSQLSNELLHKYPKKINIVVREKNDKLMMSIRSASININKILKESLKVTTGYGGGHDKACGASMQKSEWKDFVETFRKEVKKKLKEK